NAIDFSRGWAPGLKRLLAKLERDNVPKNVAFSPDAVRQWWANAFNVDEGTSVGPEVHFSNWFRIQLPQTIYKHTLIGLMADQDPEFPFPVAFRNGLVTFAPAVDVQPYIGTLRVQATVSIPTQDFLADDDYTV